MHEFTLVELPSLHPRMYPNKTLPLSTNYMIFFPCGVFQMYYRRNLYKYYNIFGRTTRSHGKQMVCTHLNKRHLESTSTSYWPSSLPSFLVTVPPNSLFIICMPQQIPDKKGKYISNDKDVRIQSVRSVNCSNVNVCFLYVMYDVNPVIILMDSTKSRDLYLCVMSLLVKLGTQSFFFARHKWTLYIQVKNRRKKIPSLPGFEPGIPGAKSSTLPTGQCE